MKNLGKDLKERYLLKLIGLFLCLIFVCGVPHPAAAMQAVNIDGAGIGISGIDGKVYTPADFSEDVVILFFGRTSCPNTRGMIAHVQELTQCYSSVKAVLMDIEQTDSGMESYAAANPQVLVAHKSGGYNSLLSRLLNQAGISAGRITLPGTFVMGRDRKIAYASTGMDKDGLTDAIVALLPAGSSTHAYDTVITVQPTCSSTGLQVRRCRNCGQEEPGSEEEVPMKAHSAGKKATCTEPQKCTVCGKELAPAKGHSPGKEATCIEPQRCTVCGEELVPMKGHSPGKEATCTEPQRCTVCGEELAPMKEHSPGRKATCTEPQRCTVCLEVLNPALGHDYEDTVIAPTATEAGYTLHVCSRCQDSYTDSYVEATGSSPEQEEQPSGPVDPSASAPSRPVAEGMSVPKKTTDSTSLKLNLKRPAFRSVKRRSGTRAVVKWKKVSGVDGYELQMSRKAKKGFSQIARLSAKKTSYTKKKLSKKKTYYFRVRAYKQVAGQYYYSAWSKVKKLSGVKK